MYTLKTRLAESEEYARVLTRFLAEILKICISLKNKIVFCWRQIQQFSNGFSQVSEDQIDNIHLLMLKNIVVEHLSEEKLLQFESFVDRDF